MWTKGNNMKTNNWYRMENLAGPETDIYVYAAIGKDGVSAADFVQDLRTVKAKVINLHIDSPGGSPFEAVTMLTALKQSKAEVRVFVDGLAASAASVLAMAGTRTVMAQHSFIMIHEAHSSEAAGSADDMRKLADMLDMMSNNIADIYTKRAGGTVEEWRARMAVETWFTDEQAVSAGLADEVATDVLAVANHFDLSEFEHPPELPAPEPLEAKVDWAGIFDEAFMGVL